MTCSIVEVDVGGPATVNVTGAVVGAPWGLVATFSDDVDLSSVTAMPVTISGATVDGGDPADIVIDADLSNLGDQVVAWAYPAVDSADAVAGGWPWKVRCEATDPERDGWIPMAGVWQIVEVV